MANAAFMAGLNRNKQQSSDGDDDSKSKGGNSAFMQGFAAEGLRQKTGKAKSTIKKAAKPAAGLAPTQQAVSDLIPSYKHGGVVKKTGLAYVHRGEHVIPAGKKIKTRIVGTQVGHPVTHHGKKTARKATKIVGSNSPRMKR